MAKREGIFLLATAVSLLLITAVLGRSISHSTVVLDVSSSLRQANHILAFVPAEQPRTKVLDQQEQTLGDLFLQNSSSFSLELHSRETLHKTRHEDYASLVRTRLVRDAARVAAITTKVQVAVQNLDMSELQPELTEIQPQDLTTPVVSGASQGSGEYFSRIGVGNPAKEFFMVLDTGSDVNWIQCEPCTDCYQQADPIFNPAMSSSYAAVPCTSPQCQSLEVSACRSNKCLYQVSYGDGSFTIGELATDTLTFGNSGRADNIAFGCGHDNEGLFTGAAGLLGLGGGKLSIMSQLKARSFSYCLVDRDSGKSSSLDVNSAGLGGDLVTAPLVRNRRINTFYYVGLTGFSVGGHPVSIPPSAFQVDEASGGGVILDCGTAISRIQTQAYNAIRDAFASMTQHLRPARSSVSLFDTCYDFSSLSTVKVPTLSLQFAGGKTLDLPAKNYLIPVDAGGTFCFAFAPTSSSLSIIGNVQQQGTRVTYDLANNLVGFSPNKC